MEYEYFCFILNNADYLFFLVYLEEKEPTEFTYAEQFVDNKRKENATDYFPIGRALSVSINTEDLERMVQLLHARRNNSLSS